MELTYKARHRIYLISLLLSIAFLFGWFPIVLNWELESFNWISVRNISGIGLFYILIKRWKEQIDY